MLEMALPRTPPAAMPWPTRAATRRVMVGAAAQATDAAMKAIIAIRNTRRTPWLSTTGPIPNTAIAAAKSSTVITHGSRATSPKSSPIDGRPAETDKLLYEMRDVAARSEMVSGLCRAERRPTDSSMPRSIGWAAAVVRSIRGSRVARGRNFQP